MRWADRRGSRVFVRGMHLDIPLLIGLALLAIVGMVTLYSASGQNMDVMIQQGLRILLAFTVMFVLAQIPPHHVEYWAPWAYAGGVVLLLAVALFGEVGKGAQRWLDLGFVRFQPSEIMKIAVPVMVAWYLSERALPPSKTQLLIALLIIAVPAVLIARQPDLGTAILIGGAGIFVLLLAGLHWKYFFMAAAAAAACAPLLWYAMHDYQRQRVMSFLDPESNPLGSGYHIIQAKIAIGSGGIYGKGWMNGTQSQLEFLPERSTDFIFAVFSEEFGLIGLIVLLSLCAFIVIRGLYIATQAHDTFTRLVAGSLVLTFFVYTFVNIGMVSGMMPVVGLPLPLISYGGTAMVTVMAGFGIVMSIHTHRKLLPS
jgi:rod shape determining protein RodA